MWRTLPRRSAPREGLCPIPGAYHRGLCRPGYLCLRVELYPVHRLQLGHRTLPFRSKTVLFVQLANRLASGSPLRLWLLLQTRFQAAPLIPSTVRKRSLRRGEHLHMAGAFYQDLYLKGCRSLQAARSRARRQLQGHRRFQYGFKTTLLKQRANR